MGVACVKLEGRMKRPEYVAVVTGIYARAIREDREPTGEELEQLRAAFSRQGFTQGYYLDQQGPDMFGVREETREPKELFAAARNTYQSGEAQRVPVTFYAMLRPGEPARVGVEDPDGRVATVEGPVPEAARTRPMTAEAVTTQLSRTGGTPYRCGQVRALVEENLSLPLAALNALRREALEKLSVQRQEPPRRRTGEYHAGARYENRREEPVLTISVRRAEQLTDERLEKVRQLDAIAESRGQKLSQMALAWVLREDKVTSVLIGASTTAQLDDAVGMLSNRQFSAEECAAIDAILAV